MLEVGDTAATLSATHSGRLRSQDRLTVAQVHGIRQRAPQGAQKEHRAREKAATS